MAKKSGVVNAEFLQQLKTEAPSAMGERASNTGMCMRCSLLRKAGTDTPF